MTGNERMVLSGGLLSASFLQLLGEQAQYAGNTDDPVILIDQTAKTSAASFKASQALLDERLQLKPLRTINLQNSYGDVPSYDELQTKLARVSGILSGGGSTKDSLQRWRAWGLDELVLPRVSAGSLAVSGASAGSLLWFDHAHSDSESYYVSRGEQWEYITIQGLGILPVQGTVHFSDTDNFKRRRRSDFTDSLRQTTGWKTAIGIDTRAALICADGVTTVVSLDCRDGSVYTASEASPDTSPHLERQPFGSLLAL